MAIFSKSDKSKIDKSNTTIIAAGTKVAGEVDIECKLHVDGEFAGTVRSKSLVTVGRTGLMEGEIVAKKLIVTGHFVGNADCDDIEILAGGKVAGQIASKVLVIERGSFFEGESKLKNQQQGGASLVAESAPGKSGDATTTSTASGANVRPISEGAKPKIQGM